MNNNNYNHHHIRQFDMFYVFNALNGNIIMIQKCNMNKIYRIIYIHTQTHTLHGFKNS